jgi:hypothetical protein
MGLRLSRAGLYKGLILWPPYGQTLGPFTFATLPKAAPFGALAVVEDTLFGQAGQWTFEFRPDQDPTYPWRCVDAAASARCVATWTGNVSNSAWTQVATYNMPAAGHYSVMCEGSGGAYNQGTAGSSSGGISTTNSTAGEIVGWGGSGSNGGWGSTSAETDTGALANGQTLYIGVAGSAQGFASGIAAVIRPVKIAGNA